MNTSWNGYFWNGAPWNGGDAFDLNTAAVEAICLAATAIWQINLSGELEEC
jgi:hypothetical protein